MSLALLPDAYPFLRPGALTSQPSARRPLAIPFLSSLHRSAVKVNPRTRRLIRSVKPDHYSDRPHASFLVRFRDAAAALPLFVCFLALTFCARLFLGLLPSDFHQRWRRLVAYSQQAELACEGYPSYLLDATVAAEDRRFFHHIGIDPVGIARAVVYFPKGGGGSTITQQLVKNVFLKSDRKISRKVIEMGLAIALERILSKKGILCSYLSIVYWGHGKFGIKAASHFYFGKDPSCLTVGECAMLTGMLPAPDFRSPFNGPSRGRFSQSRVLKRMVRAGLLDRESAILVLNQPLYFHVNGCVDESGSQSHTENVQSSRKEIVQGSSIVRIWDWEMANMLWEVKEELET